MLANAGKIMNYLLNLLPPVAASFGIIPLIVKQSPLDYPLKVRSLVLILFIGIIWIGYFIATQIGEMSFYHPLFTILPLIIGLMFLWILFVLLTKRDYLAQTREGRKRTIGPTAVYAIGLFFITIGFTNYSANEGKVAMLLEASNVLFVEITDQQDNDIKINLRETFAGKGRIISKQEFDRIKKFTIYFDNNENNHIEVLKSDFNLIRNGMGEQYAIIS
ncbi:MAG: hypothetical protein ACQ9MH_24450 [Nitrospinales bacterium]